MPVMLNGRNVVKVYSGAAGKCACGCKGKYYDGENNPMLTRVVNLINQNPDLMEFDNEDKDAAQTSGWVCVTLGKRDYVAYFEEVKATPQLDHVIAEMVEFGNGEGEAI